MKIEEINKKEILTLAAAYMAQLTPDTFELAFPDLNEYAQQQGNQDLINELVAEAQEQMKTESLASVRIDELRNMYALIHAVLGHEETNARFPHVRLLILNLADEKSLHELMETIKFSKEDLIERLTKI